jgi:hypothetical protein
MRSEFFLTGGVWSWWVFGDGQGEGGGVDLEVEPVGRLDRVAVELHRLGTVTADLHLGGPQGVHPGTGLAAVGE